MTAYQVRIRGRTRRQDDGLVIDMGACAPGQAWWEIPLPPCPDCGGDLVWFEAGTCQGPATAWASRRADVRPTRC